VTQAPRAAARPVAADGEDVALPVVDPGAGRASKSRRGWLVSAAKLAVTVAILGLLLSRIDLAQLGAALRGAVGVWLWLAIAAYSLMLISSTFRWDRLLRAVGIVRRFRDLLRLYFIGFCFSSFLPGNVGGDIVRWHAASSPGLRSRVGATIVTERITGLLALLILCWIALWLEPRLATLPALILVGGTSVGVGIGLWLAFDPRLTALIPRLSRGYASRLMVPLEKLHRALTEVPLRAVFASVGYSLPFYAATALFFFLIAQAFGAGLSFRQAGSVQLLISVLTMIPISVGGLGVAQAGDVYLLGLLGVDAPTALGMSLLRQVLRYLYASLGALLFLGWRGQRSPAELWTRAPAADGIAGVDPAKE